MDLAAWALDPTVIHLNHGGYGGCPRAVVEAAAAWRARIEAAPTTFFVCDWQMELDRARAALAAFVGAAPERLVFVPNATTGIATALANAQLAVGDEVIATDHAYRAYNNQLARLVGARGARIVRVAIALPFDPERTAAAIRAAVTARTRLAVIDHITSPTALRLPVEELVTALTARGVAVVVDGAHAPGQIDLAVDPLGATWYVGNCHKWLCAPKGAGFIVTRTPLVPLVTSHGASPEYGPPNRLHAELDWMGTHDPAPFLAVPTAIAAVAELGGGWPAVRAHNHALAIELRARVIAALGGHHRHAIAPDASLGAMAAIPIALPAGMSPWTLQLELLAARWEVPIVDHPSGAFVRVSAQLYNEAAQGDALGRELYGRGVRPRTL